jgi:hypothetical protein
VSRFRAAAYLAVDVRGSYRSAMSNSASSSSPIFT